MNLLCVNDLFFLNSGPINFELSGGQIMGLSGASGSGKSRLLRALADLDEHQGEVQLDDVFQQDIVAHQWRKKVALLSAETHWWFDTVGEHFSTVEVKNLLALGLSENCQQWSIARLSSGEKQRLALLRILQNQPQVLLLDEPTANLDKHNAQLFENFVMNYTEENSACVIWVSHDVEQLQRLSQKRYIIVGGVLQQC